MIKIQFIGVTALKEKSVLQANVDEKVLNIAIREFQELEMAGILTKPEYDRLSDELVKVQNKVVQSLSDDDKELFEYITPVMIYGALMYSISPIHRKLTNTGVKEDQAQNAISGDLAAARADYAFKLDGYKKRLYDFMHEKNTSRPCESTQDTTFNFTGMSLPDDGDDSEARYRRNFYKY